MEPLVIIAPFSVALYFFQQSIGGKGWYDATGLWQPWTQLSPSTNLSAAAAPFSRRDEMSACAGSARPDQMAGNGDGYGTSVSEDERSACAGCARPDPRTGNGDGNGGASGSGCPGLGGSMGGSGLGGSDGAAGGDERGSEQPPCKPCFRHTSAGSNMQGIPTNGNRQPALGRVRHAV